VLGLLSLDPPPPQGIRFSFFRNDYLLDAMRIELDPDPDPDQNRGSADLELDLCVSGNIA
jgi:hypothetical protein